MLFFAFAFSSSEESELLGCLGFLDLSCCLGLASESELLLCFFLLAAGFLVEGFSESELSELLAFFLATLGPLFLFALLPLVLELPGFWLFYKVVLMQAFFKVSLTCWCFERAMKA